MRRSRCCSRRSRSSTRPTLAWRWRSPAVPPTPRCCSIPPLARRGADARVRQNLALAHALAGDWTAARTIAEQDLPADQVEARLQQWMSFAKPVRPSDQLAALTGISPAAADPGQPVRLALNRELRAWRPTRPRQASLRSPAPRQPLPAAPSKSATSRRSQPQLPAVSPAPVVAEEAPPEITVPAVAIAAADARLVRAGAGLAAPRANRQVAPAPAGRAARHRRQGPAAPRALAPVKAGGAVVQLGAFANRAAMSRAPGARYAAQASVASQLFAVHRALQRRRIDRLSLVGRWFRIEPRRRKPIAPVLKRAGAQLLRPLVGRRPAGPARATLTPTLTVRRAARR